MKRRLTTYGYDSLTILSDESVCDAKPSSIVKDRMISVNKTGIRIGVADSYPDRMTAILLNDKSKRILSVLESSNA